MDGGNIMNVVTGTLHGIGKGSTGVASVCAAFLLYFFCISLRTRSRRRIAAQSSQNRRVASTCRIMAPQD